MTTDFDVIVVGSGPNGLAAAVNLQLKGLSVLLIESKSTIGGGLRTAELTLPGFKHDICSAIHPLGIASPFFNTLSLNRYGLQFIEPTVAAAHPLDNGKSAILTKDIQETASRLGIDRDNYLRLIAPIVQDWNAILPDILAPFHFPKNPIKYSQFGLKALWSASHIAKRFEASEAKALWAGMAAHAIQPLENLTTSAIGLVLLAAAHKVNWAIPKGGSQAIANALTSCFLSNGGSIQTDFHVKSLGQLPSAKAVIFDVTPRQLLQIAGHTFSNIYKWQLEKYRYGMGVFKVDWAIDGQVPFTDEKTRQAGTVHIGNTFAEIAHSEARTARGEHQEKPFVLLAQQGVYDASRAPEGKQALWGYCHVPHGSKQDMTEAIEKQIERFAPGFRERILARHTFNTEQLEFYNPNYIGGDINGGIINWRQLFTRPALKSSPYRTSTKGLYICSSSTPPGGGVHGMCGYHASERVFKDLF